MDVYKEEILDHFKRPRNYGLKTGRGWIRGKGRNASCGDMIEMGVKVEKGRVKEVGFEGEGCVISMAAVSMLTEMVKGRKVEEIKKLGMEEMVKRLGIKVGAGRKKCAGLGLEVCQKLLSKQQR